MSTTTVSATLDVLKEWFCGHGIPEQIITDNGSQFTADVFKVFTQRNGIQHVKSAPSTLLQMGLAERFVQSFKQSMKASLNDGRSLIQRLSSYLLTYHTTAHATTGVSPCKLLMSRDLRTRFSLLQPDREKSVADKQAQQMSAHDHRARSRDWIIGDRVMACNLHLGPDWVPSTIVEVLRPVTYVVETEAGQRWKRHADQLKDWLHPVPTSASESASEDILEPSLMTYLWNLPLIPVRLLSSSQMRTAYPTAESPETSSPPEPETVDPRYPPRNRRPPDRYS